MGPARRLSPRMTSSGLYALALSASPTGRAILLVRMRSVACQTYQRSRNPLPQGATEKLQAIDRLRSLCFRIAVDLRTV